MNSNPSTTNAQRCKSILVTSPNLDGLDIDADIDDASTLDELNALFAAGYTPVRTIRLHSGDIVLVTIAAGNTPQPSEGQPLAIQHRSVFVQTQGSGRPWHSELFTVNVDQLNQLFAQGFEPVQQTSMDRGKSVLITLQIRDAMPVTSQTFQQLHE